MTAVRSIMYLTISKRFETSVSARQYRPDWDDDRNLATYGLFSRGRYGHGYNYVVYLVFHGPVDPDNGMMINVTIIKERAKQVLDSRFDHKFLNRDIEPFDKLPPTAENVALQILTEIAPLFGDQSAKPVACHVEDTTMSAATAFADGRVERHHWLEFSAARRTHSPHLTDEANEKLFGMANRRHGHGHNYRLRVTMAGELDREIGVLAPRIDIDRALRAVHAELDHRHLNAEVGVLKDIPITTESLSRFVYARLRETLPMQRVRLYELPGFFAEQHAGDETYLGISTTFHAAHRLHGQRLSDQENLDIFGKCNNPEGHGHEYIVEATMGGDYNEVSGTLYDFVAFNEALKKAVASWAFKHLDEETDDFDDCTTTGENIVTRLWPKLDTAIDGRLHRLRLWETPNNRFTLRRSID
ncbi:hypothetical protein GF377_08495 [candidate division GN15 bacterium]|nr:hypothetical protein [candidate division GN15 bacterium]